MWFVLLLLQIASKSNIHNCTITVRPSANLQIKIHWQQRYNYIFQQHKNKYLLVGGKKYLIWNNFDYNYIKHSYITW